MLAALVADGTYDLIDVGDDGTLRMTGNQITIEAWVRPEPLPGGGARIVDKITPGGSDGFLLDTHPGNSLRWICGETIQNVRDVVPAGRWTHFLTGQVIEGPGWRRETYDFLSLPLLVRPNSIIAMGSHDDRPDYDYNDGVTLQVYELANGAQASATLYSLIETAKACGLEPYRYLRFLFERLPYAQTRQDYAALLPQRLTPERLALAMTRV